MKQMILAIATAAAVLSSIGSAYAQSKYDTCQIMSRANLLQCVIENSQRGF